MIEFAQGLFSGTGDYRANLPPAQDRLDRATVRRVMFDNEHGNISQGLPIFGSAVLGRVVQDKSRGEMERASEALTAFDPDFSSHDADELRANSQSEAGAAIIAGRGVVRLSECLKNHLLFFFGDANARIRDSKVQKNVLRRARFSRNSEHHFTLFGELDRIAQ